MLVAYYNINVEFDVKIVVQIVVQIVAIVTVSFLNFIFPSNLV